MFIDTVFENDEIAREVHKLTSSQDHRIYQGNAATCIDFAANQACKRGLSLKEYMNIAEIGAMQRINPKGGRVYVNYEGKNFRVHYKGSIVKDESQFFIVRTVVPVLNNY